MARRLLQIVPTPQSLLAMTPDEIALALLEDMQARVGNPLGGMANRNSLGAELVTPTTPMTDQLRPHELTNALEKAGRAGYALLEKWGLIEADNEPNGRNGFVVLTPNGKMTTPGTDFERIRVRGLLREEMLHPLLRGKIYADFASDHLDTAVPEAFRTLEDEVRKIAHLPETEQPKSVFFKVFAPGGRLSNSQDSKPDYEALGGLFAGAYHRFRNKRAHGRRTSIEVLEAMEELLLVSRLLRIVDERKAA